MIKALYRKILALPPTAILAIGLVFIVGGFWLQADIGYDDSPVVTSYSLSLGANCEKDYKQCRIRPRAPVGYRVETTRNEVVAFMPSLDGLMEKYNECTIWSSSDWSCEQGRITMSGGIIVKNIFEPDADVYYVPRPAWKLAALHILPLSSIRRTPIPKPARGT